MEIGYLDAVFYLKLGGFEKQRKKCSKRERGKFKWRM